MQLHEQISIMADALIDARYDEIRKNKRILKEIENEFLQANYTHPYLARHIKDRMLARAEKMGDIP